jgi:DNA-binding transcriptional LysR family regulator
VIDLHFHCLFSQVSCADMHNKNWDDLRFVLAVAEAGSVNGAAAQLSVNHATVLRRIAAFEDHYQIRLFDRQAKGYRLLANSQNIIKAARDVKEAIHGVERTILGQSEQPSGLVRLTSTDTFCTAILPGILAEFNRTHPLIQLDILTTNAHLSLSQLDADVTVRPAKMLPDDLTGDIAARLGFAVYGADGYVDRVSKDDRIAPAWLGLGQNLSRSQAATWMAEHVPDASISTTADSFVALRDLALAGLGLAMLPCCLGDPAPGLSRLHHKGPEFAIDIWVACHRDLADVPRVRAVCDAMIAGLSGESALLWGRF